VNDKERLLDAIKVTSPNSNDVSTTEIAQQQNQKLQHTLQITAYTSDMPHAYLFHIYT